MWEAYVRWFCIQHKTTVLVEVGEFEKHQRALLGAHKWIDCFKKLVRPCHTNCNSEMLRSPSFYRVPKTNHSNRGFIRANSTTVTLKSSVRSCLSNSVSNPLTRRRAGWKEMKWNDDWLRSWKPNKNNMVQSPYPKVSPFSMFYGCKQTDEVRFEQPSYCPMPDALGIDEICRPLPARFFPELAKPQSIAQPPEASKLATRE